MIPRLPHRIALTTAGMGLLGYLAATQVALLAFLGLPLFTLAGMAVVLAGALIMLAGLPGWGGAIELRVWLLCLGVALVLMLLGGEGRWLYATPDWQVRYAVLRDLTEQPWPFAYALPGGATVLRAPLAMYLGPALIGKLGGFHAAEQALLIQNAILLGTVLAMGSTLFDSGRQRLVALGVFLGFSGMDVLGALAVGRPLALHLEGWAGAQYSSTVTLAMWVPQHALAGWIFAVFYMAWRQGRVPVAAVLAVLPLVALMSPLAVMGAVPFGLHAMVDGVRQRQATPAALCALALVGVASLPSLLYLAAGSGAVGAEPHGTLRLPVYAMFVVLEVGAPLLGLLAMRAQPQFGRAAAWLVVLVLVAAPFGHIGKAEDFVARASIPALTMLAMMMVPLITQPDRWGEGRQARRIVLIALAIGLVTPAGEIWRALTWPPAPEVTCGYTGVVPSGYATYVAPLARLPEILHGGPVTIVPPEPAHSCWHGLWRDPISGQNQQNHSY